MVVRKIKLSIILLVSLLLLTTTVLASEAYPQGCCLGPFGPTSLTSSQTQCSDMWYDSCYTLSPLDEIALNPLVTAPTTCCCFGNSPAFTEEASSYNPQKLPSDVLKLYCDSLGDSYKSLSLLGASNCQDVCLVGYETTTITIGGEVTETDGTKLSDIVVSIEYLDGRKFNATTDDGLYEFQYIPTGTARFILSAPQDYPYNCSTYMSSPQIIDANTRYDFNLTCTLKPGACVPRWNISSWSETCTLYAGVYMKTRTITDLNNCGIPSTEPTRTLCEEQLPSSYDCNDGSLDYGEQCDVLGTNKAYRSFNNTILTGTPTCNQVFGTSHYSATGVIGCTTSCTYDISSCTPSCNDVCDTTAKCDCLECENIPLCMQDCMTKKPSFLSLDNTYSSTTKNVYDLYETLGTPEQINTVLYPGVIYNLTKKDVTLTWDYDEACENHLMGFQLIACEEEAPNSCKTNTEKTVLVNSPNTRQGTIHNVLEQQYTSYCYNVCAITADGQTHCAYESGNLPCFLSGHDHCMRPLRSTAYTCEYLNGRTQPTGCNQGGGYGNDDFEILTNLSLEIVSCSTNDVCVELPNAQGAECRAVGPCERCNGLFGFYANYDLSITFPGADSPLSCNKIQHFGLETQMSRRIYGPAQDYIGLCYKDETLSSQPAFNTCDAITSCYDYASTASCLNDPCMKFQDENFANTCEWTSYNNELGIGVCSPKQEQNIECGRCDVDSPLGFCTQEICQDVYGKVDAQGNSLCYYNQIENSKPVETKLLPELFRATATPLHPTCVDKRNMACSFYDTKQDCIGTENNALSYDMTYDISYNATLDTRNAIVLSGTNERTVTSNDYFNFGTCYWDEARNLCMKNSDDYFFHTPNAPKQDDCWESNNKDLLCLTDNEPPNTTIYWKSGSPPIYGINELARLTAQVIDNAYSGTKVLTFISFNESYPHIALTDFQTNEGELLRDTITETGDYDVSYFSVDTAYNREEIKTKTIRVVVDEPEVSITSTIIPDELNPDLYVSSLDITLTVDTSSHCRMSLYAESSQTPYQPINDKEAFGIQSLETTYVYLVDGTYILKGFCRDAYYNEKTFEETIRVQGDQSVTNSYPYGQVFGLNELDNLVFNLTTANPANCFVSRTPFGGETIGTPLESSANSLYHEVAYVGIPNHPLTSGSYTYYVKCEFPDITDANGDMKVAQNDPADAISFTIDSIPPQTTILKQTSTTPAQFTIYKDFGEPWSEQKTFRLICSDAHPSMPFAFAGCASITYCLIPMVDVLDEDFNVTTPAELNTYCSAPQLRKINTLYDMDALSGLKYYELSINGLQSNHLTTYGRKYIFFYGTDKKGNDENEVHFVNLRIRSSSFPPPSFVVS